MRSQSLARISPLAVVSAALLALLVLGATAQGATRTVNVTSNRFTDTASGNSTSTINAGDTINWVWGGGLHSSTSGTCAGSCTPDGLWNSPTQSTGSFQRTFDTTGTFHYFCVVHQAMMQGTVIVQPAGTAPTASFTFSPSGPVIGTAVVFTDTSSGAPTSWSWNFGDPASGTSNTSTLQNPTHTFLSAATYNVSLTAANASGSNATTKNVTVSAGGGLPCVDDAETLCLNNGRFEVRAEWTKPDSSSGHGTRVKLTDDSGYFWFFTDTNIELVTKVLNACSFATPAYWVFSAGLTNVGVNLTVRDATTGAEYSYVNPTGTVYVTQTATSAFPTSCP